MSKKLIFSVCLLSLFIMPSYIVAQDDFSDEASTDKVTINGVVLNASNGRPIAGANVLVDDGEAGAAADEDGKILNREC